MWENDLSSQQYRRKNETARKEIGFLSQKYVHSNTFSQQQQQQQLNSAQIECLCVLRTKRNC